MEVGSEEIILVLREHERVEEVHRRIFGRSRGCTSWGDRSVASIGGCQNALPEQQKTLYDEKKGKSIDERREWDAVEDWPEYESAYEENETAEDGGSDAESVLMRRRFVVLCSLLVVTSVSKVSTLENGSASGGVWKFWLR